MLNAEQVNTILDAMLDTFEGRTALPASFTVASPSLAKNSSVYGSVILGALLTGSVEGKLTLTFEWTAAFRMAELITKSPVESFNETVQRALEGVFFESSQAIASKFSENGSTVEIRLLPTLVDTSVLLGEGKVPGTLQFAIQGPNGVATLFLAFN